MGKGGGKNKGKTYRSDSGSHRSPGGTKITTSDAAKRGLMSKETIEKLSKMPCKWGDHCKKKDSGCLFKHGGRGRSATPAREIDDCSDWQPTEEELQEQFADLDGTYGQVEDAPIDYDEYYNQNWEAIEEWNAWKPEQ